ncbi:DNA repair protein RecO [Tepidamorphus sp. 3E244]|uniref:DNA repair protein RecO n=1 Tax=Tepidamorphus sp. 3E244 TaxID=3385498 RepID=UPI0038FC0D2B
MEWSEDGIILGTRRHGESSVIVEAFTSGHGRHLGIVKGGRSRRMQPTLQPGNRVRLTWRARLEEHLGMFQAEPIEDRAADLMADRTALAGFMTLAAHVRLLPERDTNEDLFELFEATNDMLQTGLGGQALAVFERDLLAALGFGLDLTFCAATGQRAGLVYVSPKTGRAVSAQAGKPYKDRLLALPDFLRQEGADFGGGGSVQGLADAFRLTGHFLHRHVWMPRNVPPPAERERFIAYVTAA